MKNSIEIYQLTDSKLWTWFSMCRICTNCHRYIGGNP